MKKSTLISIIALLVSIVGLATALAVFFKKRRSNDGYELDYCDDEYDFSECCDGNCCEYIAGDDIECSDDCDCGDDCSCEDDCDCEDVEVELHEITEEEKSEN